MARQRSMHADEVHIEAPLVRRLLHSQFSGWDVQSIIRLPSHGTDNALFRLGEAHLIRMPRIHWAARDPIKEHEWLPRLAPHLPLEVPVPLTLGQPDCGYPWHWTICPWLEGMTRAVNETVDPIQTALDLADFIRALHALDASDGPMPDEAGSSRGVPLRTRDSAFREAHAQLDGSFDKRRILSLWNEVLQTPEWASSPVWIHGDLQEGNLLFRADQLAAVIDFGGLAVGDPACDVMAAWLYLSAEAREPFREALDIDDATWMRARGWALSVGVIAYPYYKHSNPKLASIAKRAISEVLSDMDS